MRIFICALSLCICLASHMLAQEPSPELKKLFSLLQRDIDGNWKNQPIKKIFADLAASENFILRIDPKASEQSQRLVTFHAAGDSLQNVLYRLSARNALRLTWTDKGEIVVLPNTGATPIPDWIGELNPVQVLKLSNWPDEAPPPGGWDDPVAPLTEAEIAAFSKSNAVAWKPLLDGYVDRIEAWAAASAQLSPAFIAFLQAQPEVRREFWRALDPRFDQVKNACDILDQLRQADLKKFIQFRHLAIAIAVVFDSPDAAISSRYNMLWAVEEPQFGPVLPWQGIWSYFTDPKNQSQFIFKPDSLAWPLMVDLVDVAVSQNEIDWAKKTYASTKFDLQSLYDDVPYDNGKLALASGRDLDISATKLGNRPYLLNNLRTYGGVCVDQAHFSAQIAKLFGVPAVKCSGHGRYGGLGHAWTGYLGAKNGTPQLLFTGRYQFDFFYLGNAFDPHTRTKVLDRDVELMYAAVSGGHYSTYSDALLLTRGARALISTQPALATALAKEAIARNPFVGEAWVILLYAAPEAELGKLWQNLAAKLAEHPDTVCTGLRIALDRLPDTDKNRPSLYEQCYAMCGKAKRPDLQIQVRIAQTSELADAKKDQEVLQKAFDTVRFNIKEGTLILPLVKQVVTLSNRFAADNKQFKMNVVKDTLAKLERDFPKSRGTDVSPAWTEWQALVRQLK